METSELSEFNNSLPYFYSQSSSQGRPCDPDLPKETQTEAADKKVITILQLNEFLCNHEDKYERTGPDIIEQLNQYQHHQFICYMKKYILHLFSVTI